MGEHRRYHRMKLAVPMSFRVPPREKLITTSTLDISGTGVSFATGESLRERQELLIYLLLPSNEKVELHAKVVRVQEQPSESLLPLYRVSVKIVDPIKFDEKKFVRFYSDQLLEFFGKGKWA